MNYIEELEREKAHTDQMAAAAEMWMRRAQEAERLLACAVASAGGKIVIPRLMIIDERPIDFARLASDHDMTIHLLAHERK